VDGKLVVRIDHSVPEIRTADLAQHFFGYIVDKSIPEVIFRLGSQEAVVKND